jgi:hypothetical protein
MAADAGQAGQPGVPAAQPNINVISKRLAKHELAAGKPPAPAGW